MGHFYRGSVPAHRFLRGLLMQSLPRDRIARGRSAGGGAFPPPLAAWFSQLLPCCPDDGGTEPRSTVQPGMLRSSVDHLQLIGLEA